jgi:hypothetical protein
MKHYPTHEEIAEQILKLVNNNLSGPEVMHHRENLADIIYDLQQYVKCIPTVEEYIAKNLL